MKRDLERLMEIAERLLEREAEDRPRPALGAEALRRRCTLELPRDPQPAARVWRRLAAVVEETPSTSSHRFFNQLFAGREPVGAAAEMLGVLLNSSMYTFKVAGIQTLIELEVIDRMCELAGWEEGEGTFVPGGSLGNLVALAVARDRALPGLRDDGPAGERADCAVYVSADGHYSVQKSAGLLGLGRRSLRRIAVDDRGRMRADALDERLAGDLEAGVRPVCVVATAGTTVLGAFDPLREISEVARHHGVWLHVDGALGATFLLHPELRRRLDGVELADSLTWNAHKLMGMPLPCAAVLLRGSGHLHAHFNEAADYLFQQDTEDLNLGTKSIQCGRRNDALKLWAAWQALGDTGWARRIERQVALARVARDRIAREPELDLVCEPESVNVCFTVRERSSEVVCEELHGSGLAEVGWGVVAGRKVVRLVTANPEVTAEAIERFFDDVLTVAARLPAVRSLVADGGRR